MYRVALYLSLSTIVFAESTVTVKGQIGSSSGVFPLTGYSIELTNPGSSRATEHRAIVGSSGMFEVQSVPPGTYQARIFKDNQLVHREFVVVSSGASLIQLRLPKSASSARPASGSVSIHRLSHKPPKAAVREMKRAAKARKKGDIEKSLGHLEKAVEIDPQFVEAYVNLGARYMEVRRVDDAGVAFERAIRVDPHCTQAYSNLALVRIQQGKPREAESAARRALDIDDGNVRAHYLLGYSLAMQNSSSAEALTHFVRASESYPVARVGAAQVLLAQGEEGRAERELRAYLNTGDESRREVVQSYLSKLR